MLNKLLEQAIDNNIAQQIQGDLGRGVPFLDLYRKYTQKYDQDEVDKIVRKLGYEPIKLISMDPDANIIHKAGPGGWSPSPG